VKRHLAAAILGLSVAVAVLMAILRPVPHGHRYDLAIQLTSGLLLIALFLKVPRRRLFSKPVLAAVFVVGLTLGVNNLARIKPGSEIVRYYGTVFEALDTGRNPYAAGTIFHMDENGTAVYGNFNYPPAEIYPYYWAYKITGRWDSSVLTGTMLLLNALGCVMLLLTFPGIRAVELAAFFPFFMLGEIRTNPSLTFLVTAGLVALMVRERRRPSRVRPIAIALLFGLGLMTKFLVWPLMAAYYWNRFDPKRPASLGPISGGGGLALGTSLLLMAPFGVMAVVKEAFLFNVSLAQRAGLTTFYPNVLSGPLRALSAGTIYPVVALLVMAGAVLVAPRLRLFPALLTAASAFLLAAPTPEPQFLPIVLFLALAARCLEREGGAIPGGEGT
jgi:hypothetical protein